MDKPELKKLNLACGLDMREGYINLDNGNLSGLDVRHDITKLPLPFVDNRFEEILCNDILEHVEYIPILKDIHRILTPGGRLVVRIPHFTSKNNAIDPTHIRTFSVETMDFFAKETRSYEHSGYYLFDFAFSKVEKGPYLDFERTSPWLYPNKFMERWVNKSRGRMSLYESSCLSRLFPAQNIHVTLVK